MSSTTYGSKRLVVGAHYGLRDWLAQRATGVLMTIYALALVAQVLCTTDALTYASWTAIFASQWMRVLTFVVILSMLVHVWIGVREIFMDYVKPLGLRLCLHVLALVWLVGCAGWAIQVLWRL
jgi:succinate dehydrogenase / fumarate reductase membrane anchor subunit